MIVFACTECYHSFRTSGADAEDLLGHNSVWSPAKYPCPLCGNHMSLGVKSEGITVDLTPQELFAAFNGLGLPMERECGDLAVELAFKRSPVRRVHTTVVNRRRCRIDHIELADGTRVHLGASSFGAVVYRISQPHSYTSELLKELQKKRENNADSTTDGSDEYTGTEDP